MMAERINEEGWRLLNVANESLQFDVRTTSSGHAVLSRRDFSSSADVFSTILSREFITSVLEGILQTNPDAFAHNTGGGGVSNAPISYKDVYQAFACRIWIQGRGVAAGSTAREAFKNSLKWLGDRCTEQLNGIRKTLRVQSKVYVTCGGDQERLLNRQLQRMLSSLGEVLCGDEKLFRFTGRGGIVRKVPRKPARIGIWHYQAVVMLPTDDPFLAYTSVHNTSGSLGESTQTAQIVNEWADLVLSFRQPTIICMDSYYLCKVGRETLRQKNVRFVAAIKPDRFKRITALLTPSVQNAGESAYAFIGDRNEAAVMHWSRDTNIGKKFVLTNCFTRVPQKKPSDYVPVYDEYKSLFSGCDKFNQQLYGKTFPYQAPNDTNLAEKKNIWNYLFTSVLINVWNVWKGVLQARDPETETMSFRDFCDDLSVRIVEELCF